MDRMAGKTSMVDKAMSGLKGQIAVAFSVAAVSRFVSETTDAFVKLEALQARIKGAASDTQTFNNYTEFLNKTISDLRLPLVETTEGFSKFAASTRGTAMEGTNTMQVFRGVATAAKVMKLSNDDVNGTFLALSQMMSKGKVSSEELRQQLGERIPGAYAQAAKAMGMTQEAFTKALESGQIQAQEFLPRFAAQLERFYGDSLPAVLDTVQSKIITANNAIFMETARLGEATNPIYLQWLQLKLSLLQAVGKLVDFYNKYGTAIRGVLSVIGALLAMMAVYKVVMIASAAVTIAHGSALAFMRAMTLASALGAGTLKAAWIAVNATFAASPIGLILTGLAALVALAVWAYHEFDRFKFIVDGVFESVKVALSATWSYFKMIHQGILMVMDVMRGDLMGAKGHFNAALQHGKDFVNQMSDVLSGKSFEIGLNVSKFSKATDLGIPMLPEGKTGWTVQAPGTFNTPEQASITDTKINAEVSAGRSVRNVSVDIRNLVEKFEVVTTNVTQAPEDIKRLVQDALIRAVMDAEAAL